MRPPDEAVELARKPHEFAPRPDRLLGKIVSEHMDEFVLDPLPEQLRRFRVFTRGCS